MPELVKEDSKGPMGRSIGDVTSLNSIIGNPNLVILELTKDVNKMKDNWNK